MRGSAAKSLGRVVVGSHTFGLADVLAFLLAFALVLPVAADNGGYWPTSWGWLALVLCWAAAVTVVLRETLTLSAGDVIAAGALWLLLGWTLLSAWWGISVPAAVQEGERTTVYAVALVAALVVVRRRSYRALLAGTWAASALVCGYALLTRLFPERLGEFDPIAGYRLSEPLGYWNGLGAFAAVGALLALGLAARARSRIGAGLAAASIPPLVTTVYFTFSRGAWIALAAGLIAVAVADMRRLQFLTNLLFLTPAAGVSVVVAYHSGALTNRRAHLAAASHDGHRLALLLVAAGAANVLLVLVLRALANRVEIALSVRRTYALALMAVLAVAASLLFARFGNPATLTREAYGSFRGPTAQTQDLNRRLFNLSGDGRLPQWRVAWREYQTHAWLGSGAGAYEEAWNQLRPYAAQVRDVHNLYLETLMELGPVGLGLLVIVLGTPLVAGILARRHALAPVALGAYVVFIVHAGVDWDWELPAVTLSAVFCASALLVVSRSRQPTRTIGWLGRGALVSLVVVLAGFALIGLVGNRAIASAGEAAAKGSWRTVEARSRTAHRWAPWSATPFQLRAEAHLALGDPAAARNDFRAAIGKDPHDWTLWFGLAQVSDGRAARRALARARHLNPRSPEIRQYLLINPSLRVRR